MSEPARLSVITGAASGLGKATAVAFAAAGRRVLIVDRDGEGASRAAAEIEAAGGTADACRLDISREDEVEKLAADLGAAGEKVAALVNNAGVALREGSVVEMTRKAWDLSLAVNLTGTFLMCRHLVPLMPPGSAIVNIATIAATKAMPDSDAYAASKAGVIGLSKGMAASLAGRGIRVNVISPGIIGTEIVKARRDHPVTKAMMEVANPLFRDWGEPEDVAAAALFLVGEGSRYVTGAVLPVDGGATA
jgi:NAD(P)-dependent dehydrogenase (short-subunit alcohol dehydrogenase family)